MPLAAPPPRPPSRPGARGLRLDRRAAVLLAAVLLPLSPLLTGCRADDEVAAVDPPASASPTPTTPAPEPLRLRARVTRVAGELAPQRRRELTRAARALVAGYLKAAWLSPGDSGPKTYPGFTPGARRLAERDGRVLTARTLSRADSLSPRHAAAYVSVVAAHGRAVGATAKVSLDLRVTEAGRTRPVRVQGRLLLTPTDHGWRIFGYHVASAGVNGGKGARS